ncbi:hypothetical protein WJX72_008372 [[Myrmecia] bisecta]|uniref:Uncharacterized protein n=1 Tax=[Myrmecia] bisecta TaxID=41462 RepID=A0AAW1R7T4_9CHLO
MEDLAKQAKEQKQNNSLLQLACARGYLEDVKQLVESGADIKSRDKNGVSTLHFACGQGRLEVVVFLWQRGAALDWEDPDGHTLLHMATLGGHKDVVDFLLQKGVWTDAYNSNDDTPLHIAARKGNGDVVQALLSKGAKTTVQNKRSLTPLAEALVAGRITTAELLVQQGKASVSDRPRGWSLLHLAAGLGQAASVKFLITHGADATDDVNEERITPLHCAALAGSAACAQALIKQGASLTAAAADGRLPVDCLASKGADKDLAKLLHVPDSKRAKLPQRGQQAAGIGSKALAAPSSGPAAFKALSHQQQVAKMERWIALDDAELAKTLSGFLEEAKKRVAEARTIHQVLQIHKAMIILHEDDDFQAHAPEAATRAAIEDVRGHPERAERYSDKPAIMDVLLKLRRFQAVITANGRHQVPIDKLLVGSEKDVADADAQRTQGMRSMLANAINVAIAAASADSEQDAKRAAEAASKLPAGGRPDRSAAPSLRQSVAQRERENEIQPAEGAEDRRGRGGVAGDGDGDQDPDEGSGAATWFLIHGRPFTWKAFWREMQWQVVKALLMVALLMCVMWYQGIPLPWQRHADMGQDPSGIHTEPGAWGDPDAKADL